MPRAGLLALALAVAGPLSGAPVSAAAPAETPAAVAAAGPAASPERVVGVRHDFGRRTMGQLPANLGRSLIGVWSADNLPPFLAGGVVAGAASFLDEPTQEAAVGQLGWSDTFETAGGPLYSTVFVAGMFTAGRFVGSPRFRAMTYDMLDAAVVNFTYTEVLKAAVGRERPNGQDEKSFPSGHTSNAFALASVAQLHYGWKVGVPAYALAGLMGVSRIHEDKHWLSDVVAGAALGYVVGRTVVRVNSRGTDGAHRRATLSVVPVVARHARGLQMMATF
jgi:membrane-associated phospholipid phosphatase